MTALAMRWPTSWRAALRRRKLRPALAATDERAAMGGVLRRNTFTTRSGIHRRLARGINVQRASRDDALHGRTSENRRRHRLGQGVDYSRHRFVLDEGSRRL